LHKYKKDFTFAAAFEISMLILMAPWLNWIEHLTTDQEVAGSNPAGVTIEKIKWLNWIEHPRHGSIESSRTQSVGTCREGCRPV
jgi:hypothetical protein